VPLIVPAYNLLLGRLKQVCVCIQSYKPWRLGGLGYGVEFEEWDMPVQITFKLLAILIHYTNMCTLIITLNRQKKYEVEV